MLFSFIKYINPGWYFNLESNKKVSYFLDYSLLADTDKAKITLDSNYSSWQISGVDAAYQAFQIGIISPGGLSVQHENIDTTISDKYRFVKKYFNGLWIYYIFMIRILSLHNPIREWQGFRSAIQIQRIDTFKNVAIPTEYDQFVSPLISTQPLVSIIIPTLNRYIYLKDVLQDLENQTYSHFEVIIIDQSEPFNELFYKGFNLTLKVEFQKEKALWLARNNAIRLSKGEFILLFDDDSRVEKDWVFHHLKCLDYYKGDISSGVSLSVAGAKIPRHYSFFRWSDQIDTGNVMIRKNVFSSIGLFDRQFERQRQGDGEFGLRAYLFGFQNISNPKSSRVHLKVSEGGLRQMGSWDGFRPKNWFAPRPVPSVLYLLRKYFGVRAAFYSLLISVPPSLLPYRLKKSRFIFLAGLVLTLVTFPIIYLSVARSWVKASKMLKEGPKIDYIDFARG